MNGDQVGIVDCADEFVNPSGPRACSPTVNTAGERLEVGVREDRGGSEEVDPVCESAVQHVFAHLGRRLVVCEGIICAIDIVYAESV